MRDGPTDARPSDDPVSASGSNQHTPSDADHPLRPELPTLAEAIAAPDVAAVPDSAEAPPSIARIVVALAGLVLLSVALFAVFQIIGVDRIRAAVEEAGPWGPVVYVLLKIMTFVIAPLSSAPLRMSAGAVFGYWEGVGLTILGNAIGGSLNFWISRLVGRRVVSRLVGSAGMGAVDRMVGRLGDWRALAFARFFLAPLWDVVSYAAGFTRIRFAAYLVVGVVGDVIPTMLFVGVGTSLVEDPKMLLVVLVGFALLYGLLPFARRLVPGAPLPGETERPKP